MSDTTAAWCADLFEGRMDPAQREEVATCLAADSALRAEVVDHLVVAQQLQILGSEDAQRFSAGVLAHLSAGRTSSRHRVLRAVRARIHPREQPVRRPRSSRRRRSASPAWLVLIGVMFVLGLTALMVANPSPPTTSELHSGSLQLLAGTAEVDGRMLTAPAVLDPQRPFRLAGRAVSERADLSAAAATIHRDAGGVWRLDAGRVEVAVRPMPSVDFTLATAHAEVRVLGTRFTLDTDADGSGLTVHEGRVGFRALASGDEWILGAGESARARAWSLIETFTAPSDPQQWHVVHGEWLQISGGRLVLGRFAPRAALADGWYGPTGLRLQRPLVPPLHLEFTVEHLIDHEDVLFALRLLGAGDGEEIGWIGLRGQQHLHCAPKGHSEPLDRLELPPRQLWQVELTADRIRIVIDGQEVLHGPHGFVLDRPLQLEVGANGKTTAPAGPWIAFDDFRLAAPVVPARP